MNENTPKATIETPARFFTPAELETAYRIPVATAAKWRWNGSGPAFVKFGAKVLYRQSDVEAWIASKVRTCTPANEQ